MLGRKHDLGEGEGVNQRESMEFVVYVMLGKNLRSVNDKEGENYKQIERHQKVLSHFVRDLLLQRLVVLVTADPPRLVNLARTVADLA